MIINYIGQALGAILLGGVFGNILGDFLGHAMIFRDFSKWKFTKEFKLELIIGLFVLGTILSIQFK